MGPGARGCRRGRDRLRVVRRGHEGEGDGGAWESGAGTAGGRGGATGARPRGGGGIGGERGAGLTAENVAGRLRGPPVPSRRRRRAVSDPTVGHG